MKAAIYIYIGVVAVRQTAGVVEISGIFCAFYWIKVSFNMRFSVYIYICIGSKTLFIYIYLRSSE